MNFRQFLALARVPTLAATAVPVVVGGAIAWSSGRFCWLAWLDIFSVALLMQVGTNAYNEYGDFKHSVDTVPGPGFAGIIVAGEVEPGEVKRAAAVCYATAFLLGLLLVALRGLLMLALGSAAILVGVLYSGGPLPISSTPLGEAVVGVTMGLVEVVSADLAASGTIPGSGIVYSVPVSLTVMAILVANNVRDAVKDRDHGRRTLVVVVGRARGADILVFIVALAFAWTLPASVVLGSYSVFLVWLALPLAVRDLALLRKSDDWKGAVAVVARLHLLLGLLIALSVLLPL